MLNVEYFFLNLLFDKTKIGLSIIILKNKSYLSSIDSGAYQRPKCFL